MRRLSQLLLVVLGAFALSGCWRSAEPLFEASELADLTLEVNNANYSGYRYDARLTPNGKGFDWYQTDDGGTETYRGKVEFFALPDHEGYYIAQVTGNPSTASEEGALAEVPVEYSLASVGENRVAIYEGRCNSALDIAGVLEVEGGYCNFTTQESLITAANQAIDWLNEGPVDVMPSFEMNKR